MAKSKFIKFVEKACNIILHIGRWIGARRVLFVWSAASFAIAMYLGVTESVRLYDSNFVMDTNMFVLTRFLAMGFAFLKLFAPIFILVVAVKYIFDYHGKADGRASETFRASLIASVIAGLAIGAFYYMDAGHIIGNNPSDYCGADTVCTFNWKMLVLAIEAAAAWGAVLFVTILGLRGIYTELSFMLTKRK
ncbi:MAG: hypothetical protein LBD94_01355 [Rickettsiales bacterium]|jgi:hypothetical protein|nr:hypothetical protein [Rickettsiales bacterium]